MKHAFVVAGLWLAGAVMTSLVSAANLLQNPTFDSNIASWAPQTSGGSVSWDGSIGDPPGSVFISSPTPNTSASISQCVNISAPVNVDFIVDGFSDASSVSGGYVLTATSFASVGCGGTNLGNLPAGSQTSPSGSWQGFEVAAVDAPLPAGTASVLVRIGTSAGAAGGSIDKFHFDNIQFGPTGTIFADGFDFDVVASSTTVTATQMFPGSQVTALASVSGHQPTGTVVFLANGNIFGSCSLAAISTTKSSCSAGANLQSGTATINADYSGDDTNTSSSGSTNITVN